VPVLRDRLQPHHAHEALRCLRLSQRATQELLGRHLHRLTAHQRWLRLGVFQHPLEAERTRPQRGGVLAACRQPGATAGDPALRFHGMARQRGELAQCRDPDQAQPRVPLRVERQPLRGLLREECACLVWCDV